MACKERNAAGRASPRQFQKRINMEEEGACHGPPPQIKEKYL